MPEQQAHLTSHSHPGTDSMLLALAYLTRYHLQPHSTDSLAAGLPVTDNSWTPELFIRAAKRAGFNAAKAARAIPEISPLTLPVVIILHSGESVILEKV